MELVLVLRQQLIARVFVPVRNKAKREGPHLFNDQQQFHGREQMTNVL